MGGKNFNNQRLTVGLGDRSYDIFIGKGSLADAGARLRDFAFDGRVCVISDENVRNLYGDVLTESLGRAGIKRDSFVIAPGEESKNIESLSRAYDWFAESGRLNRDGLVVAFGGGVVGDLAGFAAATWMRGVRFVQVPTTLLAMLDSSVGGKTAIDTKHGKNLVGAFHQPSLVITDPALTASLPGRELGAGLAEAAKYGAIASESLFTQLSDRGREIDLDDVIFESCSIKAKIVGEDEFDEGGRAILNFGHTFGHAIETKYGFGKYNHGEAVAAGMRIAAIAGERLGVTESGVVSRIDSLLRRLDLFFNEDSDDLINYMKNDKKALADGVKLVLLKRVGEAITQKVTWGELEEVIHGKDNRQIS
jgi:3-dehydroquinate synthase